MDITDKHRVILIHPADPQKRPAAFYNSINYVALRYRVFLSEDAQSLEFYIALRKPYTTDLTRLYKALFGSKPVLKPIPEIYSTYPDYHPEYSDSTGISTRGEITREKLREYGFTEDQFRRDIWTYKHISGYHSPLANAFYFDHYPQETLSLSALAFIIRLVDRKEY